MLVRIALSDGCPRHIEYLIDGTAFPYISWDIGESYGGVFPVDAPGESFNTSGPSSNTTAQALYFWFFPSKNPQATDEILIWLNGGVSKGKHIYAPSTN